MLRRNPSNSPWMAYIVTVLPFIVFIFLWYAMYSILQSGQIFNMYSCAFLVLLGVLFICAIFYFSDVLIPKFLMFCIFGSLMIALIMVCIMVYNYISSYSFSIANVIKKVLLVFSFVIGLFCILMIISIFIPQILDKIYMADTMNSFKDFIMEDLHITSPPIYVLLLIEILLISGYFLFTMFFSQNTPFISSLNFNGTRVLQKGKYMLNTMEEQILATSNDLKVIGTEYEANPYLKIYSISLWLYVNPKDQQLEIAKNTQLTTQFNTFYQSKQEANIFFYGTKTLNATNQWEMVYPKPCITYSYDYGSKKNIFLLYVFGDEPYRLYLTTQKWHNLVINFHDNHMDLFVDGHLEYSSPMTGAERIFTDNDIIVIGDTRKNIYGAVADIVYYDHTLTKEQVVNIWNMQKYEIDTTNV